MIESTKVISDPQIKASTASSSFSMNDLLDEYMTVFVVIPHDRIETHATWLRLVISSAMQAIKKRARITPPRHHRCMFLIDEFGSIGHMTGLPQDIAIMAGYGLDFTLVVQGLDQLKQSTGTSGEHPTAGESMTHSETGRALLTPDEVLNLGKDVAILLNPITNAAYLRPIDYWRLRGEFPDSYPPSLSYDDNPYRPPGSPQKTGKNTR